jgi:predicted nucleic acid-binding protein
MIAVDSSTLIAYFQDDQGGDVDALVVALRSGDVVFPPVVLVEILCQPRLPDTHRHLILELPRLEPAADYWLRAAASRSTVLARGLRARLPDTLIAQSCIDAEVALIARNGDFQHFARYCGLKLV